MNLKHHGTKGMHWGERRYQNPDGTWTELGKKRRRSEYVFVSGSSKTQDDKGEYYRKKLPDAITNELKRSMKKKDTILVGDAPGIDRQVQDFLKDNAYKKVRVYGPGKEVRYLADESWETNPVDAPEYEVGSKEWLAKKDIAMTNDADRGLAVILDEGAKATRKNVQRLIEQNKDVYVYELSKSGIDYDKWTSH